MLPWITAVQRSFMRGLALSHVSAWLQGYNL